MAMRRNVASSNGTDPSTTATSGSTTGADVPLEGSAPTTPATETPATGAVAASQEPAVETEPAEKAVATVPRAAAPAVASSNRSMSLIFKDIENLFIAEFGTLPKLKASNGNILDKDGKPLGTWVDVEIKSWNKNYVVGPNADNAPSELCKFSLDPDNFTDGTGSVVDYVAELKAAGWDKAACKLYYDLVVVLKATERPSPLVGELVSVQLSPTSVKDFEGYRLQRSFKNAQGIADPATSDAMRIAVELVTGNKNKQTWTKFSFKAMPVGGLV